jgi:uncharacterized protein
MPDSRRYYEFIYHEARFRICCTARRAVEDAIRRERGILDSYIRTFPSFRTALTPLACLPSAPEVVRRMTQASTLVGVGPMAAVAGAMAALAAQAGLAAGAAEAIVDNGGDVYACSDRPVTIALYAGNAAIGRQLALRVEPSAMPLAVCSSSGKMGHSLSLGRCDLATVVGDDAALADAAATQAANLVRGPDDIDRALDTIAAIPGVRGVLIAHADRVGLAGRLPRLVRLADAP